VRARKDEGKKLEIVVRGDRSSEFNAIQRIMRLSAEAGVRDVSLAALQTADTGPVD
jgi:biopolymer transport protein ExbD